MAVTRKRNDMRELRQIDRFGRVEGTRSRDWRASGRVRHNPITSMISFFPGCTRGNLMKQAGHGFRLAIGLGLSSLIIAAVNAQPPDKGAAMVVRMVHPDRQA